MVSNSLRYSSVMQPRLKLFVPQPIEIRDHLLGPLGDARQRILRQQTVGAGFDQTGHDLLFGPRDAHHEKLVEVRAGDAQKLDALEQRHRLIRRFVEHPLIEIKPR